MSESGRLKIALERFIQATIPGVDYLAHYPGTVVAQNGQAFDFEPDSATVPGVQGVPCFAGCPGLTFMVDPSQSPRAVLFFPDGTPASAALGFWGSPGLISLSLSASDSLVFAAASVALGSASAVQASVRGTIYRAAEDSMLQGLSEAATACAIAAGAPTWAVAGPALVTAFTAMTTAISLFEADASEYVAPGVTVP
jgi:hypothetical protein